MWARAWLSLHSHPFFCVCLHRISTFQLPFYVFGFGSGFVCYSFIWTCGRVNARARAHVSVHAFLLFFTHNEISVALAKKENRVRLIVFTLFIHINNYIILWYEVHSFWIFFNGFCMCMCVCLCSKQIELLHRHTLLILATKNMNINAIENGELEAGACFHRQTMKYWIYSFLLSRSAIQLAYTQLQTHTHTRMYSQPKLLKMMSVCVLVCVC